MFSSYLHSKIRFKQQKIKKLNLVSYYYVWYYGLLLLIFFVYLKLKIEHFSNKKFIIVYATLQLLKSIVFND